VAKFGPYRARCVRHYDGDTFVLDIDLGFDHLISGLDWDGGERLRCRVFGINAPEMNTAAGKAAAAYAAQLLPVGTQCQVISHGWDNYGGRFDGEVILADGSSFGDLMIKSGNAKAMP
jgi:endonuclease YncB( thermonuclease family)